MIRTWTLPRRRIPHPPRSIARSPVTLNGPLLMLARAFLLVMAITAPVLYALQVPFYYQSALNLQNTSGMVNLSPSQWLAGLHALGLSPTVYAAQSIVSLSLMAGSMYVTGVLIFLRRSDKWIVVLVSFIFVTLGVDILGEYGGQVIAAAHPWIRLPIHAYLTLSDFSYYALFLIPLLFPDGRFVPRWSRWIVGLFMIPVVAQGLAPGSVLDPQHWPQGLNYALSAMSFGTILLSPIYRYRRVSDLAQREQTKWVLFGVVVALGGFLGESLLQTVVPWVTATPGRAVAYALIGPTMASLCLMLLPVSFAIAILRYRLWDIDLVLNRTLVYGSLTASIIGLYVVIVVGLGALVPAQRHIVLSLLATACVALLFHPLHERLQRGVNRMMYGQRDDPYAVLSRLGLQLERTLAPDAVLPSIVQTTAEALKVPYVAIALLENGRFVVAAETGRPLTDPVHIPLVYQGETIGRFTLAPRPGERSFSGSERHLLEDLARHAGVAAYAMRLTTDLQHSRERLVTAREEERRRLRRDLHDGLGPALASVILMADAARNLLNVDPATAAGLLGDLKREAQAATGEVRRVVYELRPPALDELGLVPALREQAAQYGQSGLQVTVGPPEELPPLLAAVEVAAYRIVQEALTNVVRHARARRCTVRLTAGKVLQVEVDDDGVGLDGARPGVGLTSMRERAEELGGECVVESLPTGGTRVRARLPMGARDGT